ncbi:MAG: M23 family metallopeptidase [Chloroflexota bacterium]
MRGALRVSLPPWVGRAALTAALLFGAAVKPTEATSAQAEPNPRLDTQHMVAVGSDALPLAPEFHGIWPTRGQITTFFGDVDRFSPCGHSGLDIAAPEGTPIVAAEAGEVLKAYWNNDGYGGLIIIGHPSGYETWYGHLDSFEVDSAQRVTRGEQIGLMGSTGFSTGSHLHFEIRQDGQLRDPLTFLEQAKLQPAQP